MAYDLDESAKTEQDIIVECQERFRLAVAAETENRKAALEDIRFANGEQWPDEILNGRMADERPCLTINITDAMRRRVTNALRENRPRIKYHPVGNGADVQTARVRTGLVRHIEERSNAEYAYDCAVESAVTGGWGYLRVGTEYVDERSFDQDLMIESIRNPFTVYLDPASRMPDGSDASWAVVSDMIRRDEYRQKYGHVDGDGWRQMGDGDSNADWANKEELRLAEYWRIVRREETLYLLSDGSAKFADEMPKKDVMEAVGLQIVRERSVLRKRVEWHLLSATRILDSRDWPGKWIPIIPVYGRECDINGKVVRKGMIRDLRDPARMYNYAQTAKTEAYALQPKAPWLMVAGQMEGHEAAWRDANRKPIVALPYTPVQLPDGSIAPPPERQMPPQPNSGFAEWGESTKSDFLAVAGMVGEPDQDAQGEVVSGVALKRRQGMTDVAHFDYADNLSRSLKHLGNVLSDLIPHIYDVPRMQRIIGDDGVPSMSQINQKVVDPMTQAVIKVKNDMTGGAYDTVVDTGPGYQTKREEAADAMLQLLSTPLGESVAANAGDVVIRSLDFPESETIADRIAATIPAANIDKDSDIPPKAQMMIKSLQGQLQQMQQQSMALELELKAKHGLEQMRQQGETQRLLIKERSANDRKDKELQVRREDVMTKAHTAMHDTHIKAVTAHDVAEINQTGKILDTHIAQRYNESATKEALEDADRAAHMPEEPDEYHSALIKDSLTRHGFEATPEAIRHIYRTHHGLA